MTSLEIFEKSVRDFGVKAALEYFCTPQEFYYLWKDQIKKEMEEKVIKSPVQPTTAPACQPDGQQA